MIEDDIGGTIHIQSAGHPDLRTNRFLIKKEQYKVKAVFYMYPIYLWSNSVMVMSCLIVAIAYE